MQSSGGVVDAGTAAKRAAACVLSGPAAGVAGAAFVAGSADVLTFDMGGTSTDVSASAQVTADSVVAGVPIRFPTVDVHTIGAGGGSIAWLDEGGALRVGPRSAGASPGPACYGRGGTEPTVTDAHLALGHLADGAVLGGEVVLDRALAERALGDLDPAGVIEVVNANMARALRVVSVERGIDPRGLTLVAFGGAGPLHACALAEELGIERVLVPFASGVLSALGLAVADLRRDYVGGTFEEMEARAARDLPGARIERFVDARYPGQSHELTIADGDDFHAAHERRYGFRLDGEPQVVTRRVVATLAREEQRLAPPVPGTGRVEGPAIVELPGSTCLVRPGWAGEPDAARDAGAAMDPVTLAVTSAALSGIAEEMGTVLVRSAFSSNIKERRDCSAALFDARGRMVAQAEHIPVHLGAMPESVAAVIALDPQPGEMWILNDPFAGGSHLPDITLVTRIAAGAFACTRAHHSDVGGMVPGSLPAASTSIWQEGLILPPVRLTAGGRAHPARERPHAGDPPGRPCCADRREQARRTAPGRAALPARRGVRRRHRLRRAPRARGDRAPPGRPLRGGGRGRARRGRADPGRRHRRRRPDRDRLRGHRAGGRRRT